MHTRGSEPANRTKQRNRITRGGRPYFSCVNFPTAPTRTYSCGIAGNSVSKIESNAWKRLQYASLPANKNVGNARDRVVIARWCTTKRVKIKLYSSWRNIFDSLPCGKMTFIIKRHWYTFTKTPLMWYPEIDNYYPYLIIIFDIKWAPITLLIHVLYGWSKNCSVNVSVYSRAIYP